MAAAANGSGANGGSAHPPPPPMPGCLPNGVPISVLTDSYKATHYLQYPPDVERLVAYGEFRAGLKTDDDDAGAASTPPTAHSSSSSPSNPAFAAAAAAIASPPHQQKDTRFVWFGIRYVVENYLCRRWTEADVSAADAFFSTHRAPGPSSFPFPRDLFLRFVRENDGYFPVTLRALPEGTVAHARVPVYQIEAQAPYAPLCTFLETLLTTCWYPSTVATLSRRVRDTIERSFELSGSGDSGKDDPLIPSRLHDFGMRGCTCLEQSVIGGCAHLLSFEGTDTLPAAFYAQFHLNHGKPVGFSIPATEHSVMTAWPDEAGAVLNMIERFGEGCFACVMDSYDYGRALKEVLPAVASAKNAKGPGGFMVLRPDSGDPAEVVVEALEACSRVFGYDVNAKGFKVLRGCGVIQGDGMSPGAVRRVLGAVMGAGFSASNVAFGMGGGLLQKVNRDSMSFATKLCRVDVKRQKEGAGGEGGGGAGGGDGNAAAAAAAPPSSSLSSASGRDVMKRPRTDPNKASFPGRLAVKRVGGVPTVFPADSGEVSAEEDLLRVVYDRRPVVVGTAVTSGGAEDNGGKQQQKGWEDFDALKARVLREWRALPPHADPVSASLRAKMAAFHAPHSGPGEGAEAAAEPAAAAGSNGHA